MTPVEEIIAAEDRLMVEELVDRGWVRAEAERFVVLGEHGDGSVQVGFP